MARQKAIDPYAIHLDDDRMRAERQKAREIRASQWWKRRCAKGRCHWCNRPTPAGELTMDHIIPIARGGKSIKGNLVPACKECNNQKKHLLPMEWEVYLETVRLPGEIKDICDIGEIGEN